MEFDLWHHFTTLQIKAHDAIFVSVLFPDLQSTNETSSDPFQSYETRPYLDMDSLHEARPVSVSNKRIKKGKRSNQDCVINIRLDELENAVNVSGSAIPDSCCRLNNKKIDYRFTVRNEIIEVSYDFLGLDSSLT